MYLVDSNVWLERLLDQTKADEVRRFIDRTPSERLSITDFTLHSICVIMHKLNRLDALVRFVQDAFVDGAVVFIRLDPEDTQRIVRTIEQFHLDFDDAYQYIAAEKYNLTIVSFDTDFDQTKRGRKTPAQILS